MYPKGLRDSSQDKSHGSDLVKVRDLPPSRKFALFAMQASIMWKYMGAAWFNITLIFHFVLAMVSVIDVTSPYAKIIALGSLMAFIPVSAIFTYVLFSALDRGVKHVLTEMMGARKLMLTAYKEELEDKARREEEIEKEVMLWLEDDDISREIKAMQEQARRSRDV